MFDFNNLTEYIRIENNSFGIATIKFYSFFMPYLQNFVDKEMNINLKIFHIMGCPTFRVRNAYSYAARNQSHAILM